MTRRIKSRKNLKVKGFFDKWQPNTSEYFDKLTMNVEKTLHADDSAYEVFGLEDVDSIQIRLKWIENDKATTKQVIIDVVNNPNNLKQSKDLHWLMFHLEKWGD